eukprot:jgi/Chrpa1/5047/Chrysochromulina_OHIO_Genome00002808-RA
MLGFPAVLAASPPPAASAASAASKSVGTSEARGRRLGSALATALRTCDETSTAAFCTAMMTSGRMSGTRIAAITRSASARIAAFASPRSRWNELTDSSARSGCSPA